MLGPNKLAGLIRKANAEGWGREFIRSEADERALLEGCWFRRELGQHVCNFFSGILRHSIGRWAGQPFKLEDWQERDLIHPIFSWVRADGTRRIRTALVFKPKKHGKSTMASGIMLYMLTMDGEAGAQVFCVANDRDQAGIVYRGALAMIEASPELSQILDSTPSKNLIKLDVASWMKALSGDAKVSGGHNAHCIVIDEIYAFDERGRTLYETLLYAGASRTQPLFAVFSTAGDAEGGVGFEVYERAVRLQSGKEIETSTFAYVRAAGRDDDPGDEKTWEAACPMLDITISRQEMREAYEAAKGSSRLLAAFKMLRLNIWGTGGADPWLDMAAWDRAGGDAWAAENGITPETLADTPCGAGLDIGIKSDLSAFVRVYPLDDGYYAFVVQCWLPAATILQREKLDRSPYRDWARDGWLTLTEGNNGKACDFELIEAEIAEVAGEVLETRFDRFAAANLAQRLQDNHSMVMIEMQQTCGSLSEPSKDFENLVKCEKIITFGNPLLRQQAMDVCVFTDTGGRIRPVKSTGGGKVWHRIDAIVGGIMGLESSKACAEMGVNSYI